MCVPGTESPGGGGGGLSVVCSAQRCPCRYVWPRLCAMWRLGGVTCECVSAVCRGGGGGAGPGRENPLLLLRAAYPTTALTASYDPKHCLHDIVLLEEGAGKRCSECETDGVWPRLKFTEWCDSRDVTVTWLNPEIMFASPGGLWHTASVLATGDADDVGLSVSPGPSSGHLRCFRLLLRASLSTSAAKSAPEKRSLHWNKNPRNSQAFRPAIDFF